MSRTRQAQSTASAQYGRCLSRPDEVRRGSTIDPSRWLIEHLPQAEEVDRVMRFMAKQMESARFPMNRNPASFNFDVSQADAVLIRKLANWLFAGDAQNTVLIGRPGTGKACQIGSPPYCHIVETGNE